MRTKFDRGTGQRFCRRQAVDLLATVRPGGRELAGDLGRLLDIKDGAQYGMTFVTRAKAASATRQARCLVDASDDVRRSR